MQYITVSHAQIKMWAGLVLVYLGFVLVERGDKEQKAHEAEKEVERTIIEFESGEGI